MNELNEIFADVKQEGTTLEDILTETVSESQPEEVLETEAKVEESTDALPFHKHPRWIERENELRELRERDEETARELAELKTFREETDRKFDTTTESVPDWFKELYGENEVAWKKYNEYEVARATELETRIMERQEATRTKEVQEAQRWDAWVDTQIDRLNVEGNTFDRNKLIATMLEYKPTDENNNLDFDAGMKIYKALEGKPDTAKSEARKQIADTTTHTTVNRETKKDYLTANDLRGRSMMSL